LSRLRDTARKWAAGGGKPGLLYRDEVLDEAVGVVSRAAAAPGRQPTLSGGEESFLRASRQVRRNAARRRAIIRSGGAALTACLAAAVAVASLALHNGNGDLLNANRDLKACAISWAARRARISGGSTSPLARHTLISAASLP
jgi:hypothetical protein